MRNASSSRYGDAREFVARVPADMSCSPEQQVATGLDVVPAETILEAVGARATALESGETAPPPGRSRSRGFPFAFAGLLVAMAVLLGALCGACLATRSV